VKPSEIVRSIEEDAENLSNLCGEVLATLVVNLERTNIYFVTTEAKTMFASLLEKWRGRYQRLRISVKDYPLATFLHAEKPDAELPPRESPFHAYLCVQHGGSPKCEEENKRIGMTCPKCQQTEANRGHE